MANFWQAVQWLKEDKKVRRKSHEDGFFIFQHVLSILFNEGTEKCVSYLTSKKRSWSAERRDVVATDWELFQEVDDVVILLDEDCGWLDDYCKWHKTSDYPPCPKRYNRVLEYVFLSFSERWDLRESIVWGDSKFEGEFWTPLPLPGHVTPPLPDVK